MKLSVWYLDNFHKRWEQHSFPDDYRFVSHWEVADDAVEADLQRWLEFDPSREPSILRKLECAAELAFEEYNIGNDAVRDRSMSVGDIVVIGEAALYCADLGWRQIAPGEQLLKERANEPV